MALLTDSGVFRVMAYYNFSNTSVCRLIKKCNLLPSSSGVENAHPSGPLIDWDPDIVEALDEDFNLDDPDNILDDDFVLKANQVRHCLDFGRVV